MNEQLETLLIQVGVIFFIFIIARIWMYFYFRSENKKIFDKAMRQIKVDKIMWDRKVEVWKNRTRLEKE